MDVKVCGRPWWDIFISISFDIVCLDDLTVGDAASLEIILTLHRMSTLAASTFNPAST